MKKYIFGFLIAGAMIFTAGNLQAETGVLFIQGKPRLDTNFRLNATPVNGSWRFMPGGFMVTLSGGHRFIYRKISTGHWFELHRKVGSATWVYKQRYNNGTSGISYGMHNGKRRFHLLRTVQVTKLSSDPNYHRYIEIKRGSVLFK